MGWSNLPIHIEGWLTFDAAAIRMAGLLHSKAVQAWIDERRQRPTSELSPIVADAPIAS